MLITKHRFRFFTLICLIAHRKRSDGINWIWSKWWLSLTDWCRHRRLTGHDYDDTEILFLFGFFDFGLAYTVRATERTTTNKEEIKKAKEDDNKVESLNRKSTKDARTAVKQTALIIVLTPFSSKSPVCFLKPFHLYSLGLATRTTSKKKRQKRSREGANERSTSGSYLVNRYILHHTQNRESQSKFLLFFICHFLVFV